MAAALSKRKASKDPVEDPDEDDPDFDPENPEECHDIKVVFSNKYKTPLKKPKTCIGAFCSTVKEYLTRLFIDKSLCLHKKVKEFFGDEYDKMYKLNQADFKESIFTLLKACKSESKIDILSNSSYIKLLDFADQTKGYDDKVVFFNKDNRNTSNLFYDISIDKENKINYFGIRKFDKDNEYILKIVIPHHIFCIVLKFNKISKTWGFTVIDTTNDVFFNKDREAIYSYIGEKILKITDDMEFEPSKIMDGLYVFQKSDSSLIKSNIKNAKIFGFCQIWTMFNIFYFMKYGIEKVRSNYKFFIDLLADESINKDDRYKIILCILYTWCLHHLNFTRTSVYFKPEKSKTKKSKTKKSKTKKSKTKKSTTKKSKTKKSKTKKSKTKKSTTKKSKTKKSKTKKSKTKKSKTKKSTTK